MPSPPAGEGKDEGVVPSIMLANDQILRVRSVPFAQKQIPSAKGRDSFPWYHPISPMVEHSSGYYHTLVPGNGRRPRLNLLDDRSVSGSGGILEGEFPACFHLSRLAEGLLSFYSSPSQPFAYRRDYHK